MLTHQEYCKIILENNKNNMSDTEKMIKECTPWARLAITANNHLKPALLGILRNTSNDPTVKGLPSSPGDLYTFLQKNKKKIENTGQIKSDQHSILFPSSGKSVQSSKFDITLIRFLIRTFCNIKNAKGRFDQPDANDTTLWAYVYRATEMRNKICHYGDLQGLDDKTFKDYWDKLKIILNGLKYAEDIEPERTAILDKSKLQDEILKEFQDHLQNYKHELSNKISQEFYIERRLSLTDPSSGNIMVTDIEQLIKENDRVMIYADAGVGKTATARKIKYEWCKEKILNDFNLVYFNSKQINQKIKYHSHIAPLFFSELGDYLRGKGKSSKTFVYHDIVTMKTDNLIVLVDGIDEMPIESVDEVYIDKLEKKVLENEEISASETINAIYFGFLFPFSKVCLLGRTGEFERLTKFKSEREASIFNEEKRKIKDLELLKFDNVNVQDFTCFKICGQQQQGQPNCSDACLEIYQKIKDIEICKIPTDLNSLLELHKKHPNQNIGRITRTKLIIATLLNRLNEHTKGKHYSTYNTFNKISKQKAFDRHLECIRSLGEISFKALLQDNITIQVNEEEDTNGVAFFTYEDQIKVDRKTLEELDFFYIRDFDYYFKLEPYHTLNIEFLSACYFFTHPDEWESISKLHKDRQLVIYQFMAGLHSGDFFTKDFANHALNFSNFSVENFFDRLYSSRDSLPDGGSGYAHWFGFWENGYVSPSLFFLNSISSEVDIPQRFIPPTIAFFDQQRLYQFEWYDMKYFSHNFLSKVSENFNLDSFLERFREYDFLIETDVVINNDHEFDVLNKCKGSSRVTFKISNLYFKAQLDSSFTSHFKVKSLYIERKCDFSTIDMLFNAMLPTISNSFKPLIQCNRLFFFKHLNAKQTETLFNLGVAEVVDCISLRCIFFKDKEVEILREVELNQNKLMNIEWCGEGFERLFDLPNLWKRHLSLNSITNITDNDLIGLSQYIIPVHSANLSKYKIIEPSIPFARKKNHLLGNEESMYLNFYRVIFTNVSPEVFASTFSSVPSLTFGDVEFGIGIDHGYIPESHWLSLSQTKDCLINEMRIWYPQQKHYEHFLNIKTNMIQFVCLRFEDLLQLVDHIKNNPTVQSDKEIRVFVVKCYHYVEIPLFCTKTIKEFKDDFSLENLISESFDLFYGCDNPNWWCCEISVPFQKYS